MASICMTVGLVTPTSARADTTSSLRDISENLCSNLSLPAGTEKPGCCHNHYPSHVAKQQQQPRLAMALGLMRMVLTLLMALLELRAFLLPLPAPTTRTNLRANSSVERCIPLSSSSPRGWALFRILVTCSCGSRMEEANMETKNSCAVIHPRLRPLLERCLLNDSLNKQGGILEIKKPRSR